MSEVTLSRDYARRHMNEYEIFRATVYGECRGECAEGQLWVAWVIKNRSHKRRQSIKDVCLAPVQFECWDKGFRLNETAALLRIDSWLRGVYQAAPHEDPTGGCDHFDNPRNGRYLDQRYPRLTRVRQIGGHMFYK